MGSKRAHHRPRNRPSQRTVTDRVTEGVQASSEMPEDDMNGGTTPEGECRCESRANDLRAGGEGNDLSLVSDHEIEEARAQFGTSEFETIIREQDWRVQEYILCLRHQLNHVMHSLKQQQKADEKSKESYELQQLKIAFEKLQTEALSSVESVQASSDDEITRAFEKLQTRVYPLVSLLCKLNTGLSREEWQVKSSEAVARGSVDFRTKIPDTKDKDEQKLLLKNVVWCFLHEALLREPLRSFADPLAPAMNEGYWRLFPDPHQQSESGKWRHITATRLALSIDNESDRKLAEQLLNDFEDLVKDLGIDVEGAEFQKKAKAMLEVGITFARLIAKQPAIFELEFPRADSGRLEKAEDDELMSCLDNETETEIAGTVWLVSEPALIKWGTGTGHQLETCMCLVKAKVELM
ncbi:hypothetical protein AYL99_06515 [Fonsecaea erecta]|uniref:Uncharacterized protein n=1 Tax=Fonsecaea erecta TaxID=1367422 RepID=A0A178ZHD5_9EURO|nr:hypothetical protein AYL99_06515 [Fonsecaea erecta]OAP59217.1 hypothetical protein AYL99_06515 [Fonsecaea erecta]